MTSKRKCEKNPFLSLSTQDLEYPIEFWKSSPKFSGFLNSNFWHFFYIFSNFQYFCQRTTTGMTLYCRSLLKRFYRKHLVPKKPGSEQSLQTQTSSSSKTSWTIILDLKHQTSFFSENLVQIFKRLVNIWSQGTIFDSWSC